MATSTASPSSSSPAGWYADPTAPGLIRYWDGRTWTVYTLPKPEGWSVGPAVGRLPWWQRWWSVFPGLLLCLPPYDLDADGDGVACES